MSFMRSENEKFRSLWILVISTIVTLLLGVYYNRHFIIGQSFNTLRLGLYLAVPLALNSFYFQLSWRDLGLGRPQRVSAQVWRWIWILVFGFPLILVISSLNTNYLDYYPQFRDSTTSWIDRLSRFSIFTATTLLGWEFLLRSFFTFTCLHLLVKKWKLSETLAETLVILWVLSIETCYHFIKPDMEAWGVLIFSPLLTWMALRFRSFWIPLGLHIYVEVGFILMLLLA